MTTNQSLNHERSSTDHLADGVIVHARGQLSAAEHVYAHDRIAQLRSIARGGAIRGSVMIVKPAPPADVVHASADVQVDGEVWRATAEAPTVNLAVDGLREQLHARIVEGRLETKDREE